MSVTGLKSFQSSYCVLKSPTRSDKKFCWMFCLVLRKLLIIKSLLLGSVIFRNDMLFISYLIYFSNKVLNIVLNMALNMVLNMVLIMVLNMVLNMILNMSSSCSCRISIKNRTLASVSILPVFSRFVLDFILRSFFIRVNVSNYNKLSEYSSYEIELSDNAFEMRLLIVLSVETANISIFSSFSIFNNIFLIARFPTTRSNLKNN